MRRLACITAITAAVSTHHALCFGLWPAHFPTSRLRADLKAVVKPSRVRMRLAVQVSHTIYRVSQQRHSRAVVAGVGKELAQACTKVDKLNTADTGRCLPLLRTLKHDEQVQQL